MIQDIQSEASPFAERDGIAATPQRLKEVKLADERSLLQAIAGDASLDTLDIQDENFREAFQRYQGIQFNPGVPDAYRDALQYLYRLFIERELSLSVRKNDTFPSIHFMLILNRLLDDLT